LITDSDSKLFDVVLAFAVVPGPPGRVRQRTRAGLGGRQMGGAGAPDDLDQGAETQAWLAAGEDPYEL
jgi:hypothetical protein